MEQSSNSRPCDSCPLFERCATDGHRCRAVSAWRQGLSWTPVMRCRPGTRQQTTSRPADREKREPGPIASRADLHRVFDQRVQSTPTPKRRIRFVDDFSGEAERAERRARANVNRVTDREKQPATTATINPRTERNDETDQSAKARGVPAAIVSAPDVTSTEAPIVAPAASCKVSLEFETERRAAEMCAVEPHPQAELSFRDAMAEHAKVYLTLLLTATGGDRTTAALVAGINRTHLQQLVKRFRVAVPANLKLRGRPRSQRPI